MKRVIKALGILILAILLVVSCDNNPETKKEKEEQLKTLSVSMDVFEGKDLSSGHDREVAYFSVDSIIISSTQKDAKIVGQFTGLKIDIGEGISLTDVDLGLHTQGKWSFTVSACNKNGDVIYQGSSDAYISEANETNKVTITLTAYTVGTGTLSMVFRSLNIAEPRLLVEYQSLNSSAWETLLDSTGSLVRNFESTDMGDGYIRLTASNISLPTGAYKLSIKLYNSGEIFSGETLDTYIFKGKNTELTGDFTISGIDAFVPIDPGQTMKFTEAAEKLNIMEGHVITGFYVLGVPGEITFPYTNESEVTQYLIPIDGLQSTYFNGTSTLTAKDTSSLRYIAIAPGYTSSPTTIGEETFKNVSTLKGVYAPSINTLEASSFMGTSSLDDWKFDTLQVIGSSAFEGSGVTETPKFSSTVILGDYAFKDSGIGMAIIPAIETTGTGTFSGCTNLKWVECSTAIIGTEAFKNCSGIETLLLENTITISASAFENCSSIVSVKIPETVTTIGASAFSGCSSLDGTFHIPGSIGTDGGDKNSSIVNAGAIGANAFAGTTSLDEIFIDRINGGLTGAPWGASCPITYWAYKIYFNANPPEAESVVSFPKITQKNGVAISPIDDPGYRLVSYNAQMGMTLDGYPFTIPTTSGYGFIGWYTDADITRGTKITEQSVHSVRSDVTLYAQWQKGLVTIVFNPGQDYPYGNAGEATEIYRPVRYMSKYGIYAAEDQDDDIEMDLPTASVDGRTFLGWYLVNEPKITSGPDEGTADEVTQRTLSVLTNTTLVTNKDGHLLYAHYRDHRYTVAFDSNLPTFNASTLTKSGEVITAYPSAELPSRTVRYGFKFKRTWSGDNSTDVALPSPVLDNYYFGGWYPTTELLTEYSDNTNVPAKNNDGDTINLHARWIGKELKLVFKSVETTPAYLRGASNETQYAPESTTTVTYSEYDDYYVRYTEQYNNKVNPLYVDDESKDYEEALPIPYRAGYTFNGWYYYPETPTVQNQQGGSLIQDTSIVSFAPYQNSGSVSLYAKWEPNTITVTYDANGGSFESVPSGFEEDENENLTKSVTYHSNYGTQPTPVREGYKFVGWFESNARSGGLGYSGALVVPASTVQNSDNHTLYAAWASYELVVDQEATNTSFSTTNWAGNEIDSGSHATITYSTRQTTYTIKPRSTDGNYINAANTAINPELTVTFKAILYPTSNGSRDINGVWTDGNETYVTDHIIEYSRIGTSGVNQNDETSLVSGSTDTTLTIKSVKPGTNTWAVYDANYYGDNKTNDSANYAKRNKIIYICAGDSTGFSVVGDDSIVVRNTKNYSVTYTNKNTHTSQRGVTWGFQSKLGNEDSITNAGAYTAGYETGNVVLKAASSKTLPEGVSTYATKSVTVNAIQGTVRVANGTSMTFTFAVSSLLNGTSDSPGVTIPTTQCLVGFFSYDGSTTGTKLSFAYTNSTGHTVWLYPLYLDAQNSTADNFLAPADQEYLAYPANVTKISGTNQGTVLKALYIQNACTEIINASSDSDSPGAFESTASLTDVYIGTGLVAVGNRAFSNSKAPISSAVTGRLTTIGEYAFWKDTNITGSHTIKCTNIGTDAFRQTNISSLSLLSPTLTADMIVGNNAFRDCKQLTTLNGLQYVTTLGGWAFAGAGLTGSLTIPSNITSISDHVFGWCTNLRTVTINITSVPSYTFCDSGVTSVTFSSVCTSIGTRAFEYCTSLSSSNITWGGITTIGPTAFIGCTGFTTLTIPASVTTIGWNAFEKCTSLTSVTFSQTAGFSIEARAFMNCSNLTSLAFPNLNFKNMTISEGAWEGCNIQSCRFTPESFGGNQTLSTTATTYVKCPGHVDFSWYDRANTCTASGNCDQRTKDTANGIVSAESIVEGGGVVDFIIKMAVIKGTHTATVTITKDSEEIESFEVTGESDGATTILWLEKRNIFLETGTYTATCSFYVEYGEYYADTYCTTSLTFTVEEGSALCETFQGTVTASNINVSFTDGRLNYGLTNSDTTVCIGFRKTDSSHADIDFSKTISSSKGKYWSSVSDLGIEAITGTLTSKTSGKYRRVQYKAWLEEEDDEGYGTGTYSWQTTSQSTTGLRYLALKSSLGTSQIYNLPSSCVVVTK